MKGIYYQKLDILSFAFANSFIKNLTLNEGLEIISDNAFQNNSFTSVTIPSTIKRIGNNIFSQNVALKTINIKRKEGTVGNAPLGCHKCYSKLDW